MKAIAILSIIIIVAALWIVGIISSIISVKDVNAVSYKNEPRGIYHGFSSFGNWAFH